jgi:hypothetical protein
MTLALFDLDHTLLSGDSDVLCPGTVLTGVAAEVLAPFGLRPTRLQMLRVRPSWATCSPPPASRSSSAGWATTRSATPTTC